MTTLLLFRAADENTPWGWPLLEAWDRILQDLVRRSELALVDLSGPAATRRNLDRMLTALPASTVLAVLAEGAPPEDERYPGILDSRGHRTLLDAPIEGRVILLFCSQSAVLADELLERGALAVLCFRGDLALFGREPGLELIAQQLFQPLAEWLRGGHELGWIEDQMAARSAEVTAHRHQEPAYYTRERVFIPEGLALNARNVMVVGERSVTANAV